MSEKNAPNFNSPVTVADVRRAKVMFGPEHTGLRGAFWRNLDGESPPIRAQVGCSAVGFTPSSYEDLYFP